MFFDILFGWRKASKCKNLVRRVRCRLSFLKKKGSASVRQLREEIAQILENGQNKSALALAEQLFKDQNLLAAYDLLDHFCEFIIIHLPYIRRHRLLLKDPSIYVPCLFRDCPGDINEAVSTLIFAASWFGDLPELQTISKLFRERYRQKHMTKASFEVYPGSLVNEEIREKLCIKSIPEEVKLRLLNEIPIDYSLPLRNLRFDNNHKLHALQVSGKSDSECAGFVFEGEAQVIGSRASKLSAASSSNRIKTGKTATLNEMSFQLHRISVVYLDEIVEFQFDVQDHIGEHKRAFIFNPTIPWPLKDNYRVHRVSPFASSHLESSELGTAIPETQDRRACPGQEAKRSTFLSDDKNLSRQRVEANSMSRKCMHRSSQRSRRFSHEEVSNPCLNHPGYFCTNVTRDWESPFWMQIRARNALACFSKPSSSKAKCEHVRYSPPQKPNRRNCQKSCTQYCVIASKSVGGAELSDRPSVCDSSQDSCSMTYIASAEPERFADAPCSKTGTVSVQKPKSTDSYHSHVHPKLPDYDELEAKFRALKRDYLQRTLGISHDPSITLA